MAAANAVSANGLSSNAAVASSAAAAPASPSGSSNGSENNGNGTAATKRKRDDSSNSDEVMAEAGASPSAAAAGSHATAINQIKEASSGSASPALSSKPNNGNTGTASNGSHAAPGPIVSTTAGNRDEKGLIRDYFGVLQSFDNSTPPILSRRLLPDSPVSDEPEAKRQKADGSASQPNSQTAKSISDKVKNDAYMLLDDLVLDIAAVVRSELAALDAPTPAESEGKTEGEAANDAKEDVDANDATEPKQNAYNTADKDVRAKRAAIAHIAKFREAAYDLYRRETAYPKSGPLHGKTGGKIGNNVSVSISSSNRGEPVLTVFGNAPGPRQLFSSLPSRGSAVKAQTPCGADDGDDQIGDLVREDIDVSFGGNMTLTRVFAPPPPDKNNRAPTFGELFPSPRNLPPLQPPKAPKSTTKSTTLGFYHPELAERSKYRTGSYSTQQITMGHWLDYSNATPSSQIKTRQRERAQSLAGRKPSATEIELSEMESLFRGAFSSFAPSKDDSAAIVPATQVGRMWWQRVGHRVFQRMVEKELNTDEHYVEDASTPDDLASANVLDEEALQKTIAEWDDSLVDPSLEEVMGAKSDADNDADEMLQEVSDLVITLASYQRNRNLTLPTSQDRFSADPVNADMLRNGTLAQQPSEEEMLTYQTLKAQLSLIIQALPPYAVARLNSDKLEELNISTKIEVRGEEYHGILDEDESIVRARQAAQAAQAATSSPQRTPAHRSASVSVNHNYGPQFNTPSRTPMVSGGAFYPGQHQTPARAGPPHRASVAGAGGTPAAALPPHVRPGAQAQPPFRPSPNGYNYGPMAKAQPHMQARQGMQHQPPGPGFAPGQQVSPHMSPQRVASQPLPGSYGSPAMQPGTPQQFRYPPGTPGFPQQVPLPPAPTPGAPQQQQHLQQQQLQQQQQQRRASHSMPYPLSPANGVAHVATPHHSIHQPPQHVGSPQQRFQQAPMTPGTPQQQQQQLIRQQQQLMARPPFTGQTGVPSHQQQQRHFSSAPGGPSIGAGPFGYHTVMDQPQQQRLMEQARARASAHERTMGFTDKMTQGGMGQVAGLAGIGLGGGGGGGGGGGIGNGGVDMSKLAAARANMPAGGANMPRPGQYQTQPSPQPQFQSPVPPQAYLQQQQQQQPARPQGQPSPATNGTPQPHHIPSPSPVPMSASPVPGAGFQRPP
ncbi:hypothetical protein HMPREF1624_01054 [Sporothrix schenckii ATCC 58251]|uniref:Uncharacterized protein n=1 Tax=Sporothrix schenckii (strain ATCC 58251 / de Perez 2211183) TaxID=1391915 RepID=U7Q6C1_SPOS1|nr:hypothetical protein HMPREF1624_01054 [Sporothrix schenckii ATCC 58251]